MPVMPAFRSIVFALVAATTAAAVSTPSIAAERPATVGVFTWVEPDNPKLVGAQLTATWLSASEARIAWPAGVSTSMTKLHEHANLVILQSIGAIGSTSTLYIESRKKRFILLEVGALSLPSAGGELRLATYRGQLK